MVLGASEEEPGPPADRKQRVMMSSSLQVDKSFHHSCPCDINTQSHFYQSEPSALKGIREYFEEVGPFICPAERQV